MNYDKKLKLKHEVIKILVNHHISDNDIKHLQESFKAIDKDQNGELSLQEMCDVMK